ncbi:MAG: carboxypeptidase-like regulatory domain-containing protein [Vicinamibacterales bacterium]
MHLMLRAFVSVAGLAGLAVSLASAPITRLDGSASPSAADPRQGTTRTLSGRVTFQRTVDAPPLDHTTVVVTLTPLGVSDVTALSAPVHDDGTFSFSIPRTGTYALGAMLPPAFERWWLEAALSNERDVLDERIEVTPDFHLKDVVLSFADRRPELSGTIKLPPGSPITNQAVVIFPVSVKLRTSPRRIRWTTCDASGHYQLRDVPPGDYWFAVVTDFTPRNLTESIFFDILSSTAEKVSIGEAERKQHDLTPR